jgi:hypothetical protein
LIRDDAPKFIPGVSFDDWFQKNEEVIKEMYRNDAYELLFEAWSAGFDHGLAAMQNPLMRLFSIDKRSDQA